MTVRELNEKLGKIDEAINEIYRYFPNDHPAYYYERPDPDAVILLREYAEKLLDSEVV